MIRVLMDCVCCLLFVLSAVAAERGTEVPADTLAPGREWSGLPIFGWDEATGFVGGGMVTLILPDSAGWTDTWQLVGIATTRNQQTIGIDPDLSFQQDRLRLTGELDWDRWEEDYSLPGNDSPDSLLELQATGPGLELILTRAFLRGHFVGVGWKAEWKSLREELPGFRGGRLSGPGLVFTRDSRDRAIYPTSGWYFQAENWHFSESVGSTFDYRELSADLRRYQSLGSDRVLAWQLAWARQWGAPGFRHRLSLADELRAYGDNRFTDLQRLSGRAELRWPLFWKLGLSLFAGAGQVIGEEVLALNQLRHSAGVGFRYRLGKEHRLNLALDIAVGRDDMQLAFSLGEAF